MNFKLSFVTLVLGASISIVAFGMGAKNPEGNSPSNVPQRPGPGGAGGPGFIMAICIGNILGQQGVAFPIPQPNQKPTLDETLKKSFEAAAESCKSQLEQAGWKIPSKPVEQK